jgi:hypothetical protein
MNQNPHNAPPGVPFPPGTPTSGGRMWHGLQSSNRWSNPIVDSGPVQLGDAQRAEQLWKVTVFGTQVWVDIAWGPNGKRTLRKLDPPLVVYVPGQVTVEAYPSGIDGASEAVCMIAPVDGPGVTTARRFVAGNSVALSNDAAWFVALQASSLMIGGFGPFAVAAGERVPLRSASTLVSGSGFEEFEI